MGEPGRNGGVTLAAIGDVALLRPPSDAIFRAPWDTADLRIANLESPLTDGGVPATKLIRLRSPVQATQWLSWLHCDVVSLANNHIMDWGEPGLVSTLRVLDEAGIHHAGAGRNAEEAGRHTVVPVRGWRLAFLSWACTVPPGAQARSDRAGLAGVRVRTSYAVDACLVEEQPGTPPWVHTDPWPEDVERLLAALRRAREDADLVVLSLHWGVPPQWANPFQGPLAEYQPVLGKQLVEAGADLVLGHHAHTVYGIQAIERAGGSAGLIIYSLGNYLFHPLADLTALDWDPVSLPYRPEERPENRESYVACFELRPDGRGRLAVGEARLTPALLDEQYEPRAPSAADARRIAERVARFSAWRGTPVEVENGLVVWRAT